MDGDGKSDAYELSLIAEVCNKNNINAEYCIYRPKNEKLESPVDFVNRILSKHPKIIGLGARTCYSNTAITLAKLFKSKCSNIITVLGGYHASGYPEVLFDAEGSIDFICIGASDKSFFNLINELNSAKPKSDIFKKRQMGFLTTNRFSSSVDDIMFSKFTHLVEKSAFGYLDNDKICLIERTSDDMFHTADEIPIPRRNILEQIDMKSGLLSIPSRDIHMSATLQTSRGCPQNCTYCQSANVFGVAGKKSLMQGKIKTMQRSIKNIVKELEYLSSIGVNFVFLTDLTFNLNGDHIKNLSKEVVGYKERGLINPLMGFYCMCQPHTESTRKAMNIDESTYFHMKRMGVVKIAFGIEFPDEVRLKSFNRRPKVNDALFHLESANRAGIFTKGLMMYGSHDETLESLKLYSGFMVDLPVDNWRIAPVAPFPGTVYGNQIIRDMFKKTKFPEAFDSFDANSPIIMPKDNRLTLEFLKTQKDIILKEVYSSEKFQSHLKEKAKNNPELSHEIYEYMSILDARYLSPQQ